MSQLYRFKMSAALQLACSFFLFFTAVSAQSINVNVQQVICAAQEQNCEVPYCFDGTCDGLLIESAQNGRCRCQNGLIRDRRTRLCTVPAPNCILRSQALPQTQPPWSPPPPSPSFPPMTFPPQTLPPPPPTVAQQDLRWFSLLYSMYSSIRTDHFYVTNYTELTVSDQWSYVTEEAIGRIAPNTSVVQGPCPNLRPLERMWEPVFAIDHFYTADAAQVALAKTKGYNDEGTIGYCVIFQPDCGATKALHRFWNNAIGDHIYLTKKEDVASLQSNSQWAYEGIECYIWPTVYPPGQGMPPMGNSLGSFSPLNPPNWIPPPNPG